MKSQAIFAVHIGLILALLTFSSAFAYVGSGTPSDPYQIITLADWNTLMNTPADWDNCFILKADLDWGGLPLTPVGNDTTPFTGVFDGGGHTIRNAFINLPDEDYVGLFGFVVGAQIRNLNAENLNITGRYYVGGLIGKVDKEWGDPPEFGSVISSCSATGSVSGENCIGGLIGSVGSEMSNTIAIVTSCYSSCSVVSSGEEEWYDSGTGGLIGSCWGSEIANCYASGSVSGNNYVGGLIGSGGDYVAKFCYSAALVNGTFHLGGLAGEFFSSVIESCFWDVEASGQTSSFGGGIGIGLPTASMQNPEVYLRAFWDFKGEVVNGTEDIWTMPSDGGYPILTWQTQPSP